MKKFFYSLIGLLAVVASSCSDSDSDEVAVTVVNKTYSIGVTVSTSSAYESYGSSLFTNFLGNYSNYYVGVFAYLYDEDGALVASTDSYSQTLNTQSLSFSDIDTGSYTLVCIQMLVNSSNSYQSAAWTISGTSKLSTIAVTTSYTGLKYYHAVAKSTSSVTVGTSNTSVSVSTKPLGCLIDIGYENFGDYGMTLVGFFLDQYAIGYYFDPSLSGTEQYYYGDSYSGEHEWTSIAKTYDTDDIDDSGEMNGYYFIKSGETTYCFGISSVYDGESNDFFISMPSGGESFTFEDGEYYQAYIYYTDNSNVYETYLGSHDDFDEWYEGVSAGTVWTPCTDWGASVADVQSYMSGYEMTVGSDGTAVWDGSAYYLQYTGNSPATDIYCYFSSETGSYYTVDTYYDSSLITEEEIIEYLDENYTFYTSFDYSVIKAYYYYTEDKSTAVTYMYYYGQLIVTFSSYETIYGSSSETDSDSLWVPCIDWGASVADVQSYMSDFTLYYGSEGEATYYSEGTYLLAYLGESPVDDIYYYFSTATTDLTQSLVWYDSSAITYDELLAYLDENYNDAGSSSYDIYYNDDFSTIISLYDYSDSFGEYCMTYYSYASLYGSAKSQAKGNVDGSVDKGVLETKAESLRQSLNGFKAAKQCVTSDHSQRMNLLKSLKR